MTDFQDDRIFRDKKTLFHTDMKIVNDLMATIVGSHHSLASSQWLHWDSALSSEQLSIGHKMTGSIGA